MARQYLRLTPETVWGNYNGSATPLIVQLDQNNAFTMRPEIIPWSIRSAGGYNRRVQKGSSKTQIKGNLNILAYGSQMTALVPWIFATNATNPVLGSMTIDHAILMEDTGNTTVYRRYLGVMVDQCQFTAGEQNQLVRLQLQLTGKQPATITSSDFPEPSPTAYPYDAPYVFEMAAGAFTLGTSRVEFEEFNLTVKNMLDPRFMASQYLTRLKYTGRDVDFTARFPYITTIDRSSYESVTAAAASIVFTNGSHSLGFDFQTNSYYAKVEDDLALDKIHLQSVDMESYFDHSQSPYTDIVVSVS